MAPKLWSRLRKATVVSGEMIICSITEPGKDPEFVPVQLKHGLGVEGMCQAVDELIESVHHRPIVLKVYSSISADGFSALSCMAPLYVSPAYENAVLGENECGGVTFFPA